MTCIVGLVHNGIVYIGGDSAGIAGYQLSIRKDKKVFRNGDFVMGFTTSFRMGQLLAYALKPPPIPKGADLMHYMTVDFINSVRDCLKAGGWASKKDESEEGGQFIVGVKGQLFFIDSDYQVGKVATRFDAAGCGAQIALGAMHATPKLPPKARIMNALSIASRCSAGVRGPFHVVQTP